MKKILKIILIIMAVLLFLPLFFSGKASAAELPVATSDNADLDILQNPPVEKFFDFSYPYNYREDSSSFSEYIKLIFDFPVQLNYISWYLKNQSDFQVALNNGDLSLVDFSQLQQSYELAWLHILLQSVLTFMIFLAMYKVVRNHLG